MVVDSTAAADMGGELLRIGVGGESVTEYVFGDAAGNQKMAEVVGTACLGAAAGEFEAAEGLATDQSAGDFAVDV